MSLLPALIRPFPRPPEGRPLVFGHRGASADAPENTLEAFDLAVQQGADGIEFDVMVCGSGEVVVLHDPWLDRLAGVHRCVHDTSLSELRTLDVSLPRPAWGRPCRIPTLEELFEAVPRGLLLNIELKEERWVDGGLARKVAALVKRHGAEERVVISAFHPAELVRMRGWAPRLPLGFLFEEAQGQAMRMGLPAFAVAAQAVHPEHTLCTPRAVEAWRLAGLRIAVWTVDDPEQVRALAALEVDALITNRPGAVLGVLKGGVT